MPMADTRIESHFYQDKSGLITPMRLPDISPYMDTYRKQMEYQFRNPTVFSRYMEGKYREVTHPNDYPPQPRGHYENVHSRWFKRQHPDGGKRVRVTYDEWRGAALKTLTHEFVMLDGDMDELVRYERWYTRLVGNADHVSDLNPKEPPKMGHHPNLTAEWARKNGRGLSSARTWEDALWGALLKIENYSTKYHVANPELWTPSYIKEASFYRAVERLKDAFPQDGNYPNVTWMAVGGSALLHMYALDGMDLPFINDGEQVFAPARIESLHHIFGLVTEKQHDYGHSNIDAFGPDGIVVRMSDKAARIENLIVKGADPENEPLIDSFTDLVGYASIALLVQGKAFHKPHRT